MGNKRKKQARRQRLEQRNTKPKPQSKSNSKKSGKKFLPLRMQPILFVRGDNYEPVKYAMGDPREREQARADILDGEKVTGKADVQAEVPVSDLKRYLEHAMEGIDLEREQLDIEQDIKQDIEPVETLEQVSENESEVNFQATINSSSSSISAIDFESDLDRSPEILPSDLESISSLDMSDIDFSDTLDYEPVEGTSYFGDYEVADEFDDPEPEPGMAQDIDYNDMDLDDLVRLGISIDDDYDDYDLDEYDDFEDADDVIAGLLAGESLNAYGRAPKKPKKHKQELSKRRRARIEAREASRATNFGKDPPLWQKFPEQMTVAQVVEEIQSLVYTPNIQELRFPPLDHNANWYVSELAKLHGLKVKSYTGAKANCVLALKTSRSRAPEGPARAKMGQLMHRRQTFRRIDTTNSRELKDPKEPKAKTKVSSRPKEGDIVGINAAAVSQGIGHRLMQEMGWSAGTGLGVLRDGIQLPLLARVKLTKGGLGERVHREHS